MRRTKGVLFLVLALPLLLASCSRGKEERHRIAVVNDAPIYLDDFHREVAIAAERDPAFSVNQGSLKAALDKMVEKRLIIQEAKKRGITEDERFIVTIKAFWEQTLIQRLMEELNSELSAKIYVTDEEVRRHYERMGVRVTLMTVRSISEAEAVKVKALMEGGKPVEGAEELGPLFLEDIGPSSPLKGPFALP